jgi:hypothetical protein
MQSGNKETLFLQFLMHTVRCKCKITVDNGFTRRDVVLHSLELVNYVKMQNFKYPTWQFL